MKSYRLAPTCNQRGFTLVELMVAVAIALFLLLGFTVAFINMKQSFNAQDRLALLQDNERLAMTILSNAIQSAGYFPDPVASTAALNLPVVTPYTYAGQGIFGTTGTSGSSDTLVTRFVSIGGDGLMDCLGQSNTGLPGTKLTLSNSFDVNVTTNDLTCTNSAGTTVPVVSGVKRLSVLYGTGDRYLSASSVSAAALWGNIKTARITISYINPNSAMPGQSATVDWVHTVSLMNKS